MIHKIWKYTNEIKNELPMSEGWRNTLKDSGKMAAL